MRYRSTREIHYVFFFCSVALSFDNTQLSTLNVSKNLNRTECIVERSEYITLFVALAERVMTLHSKIYLTIYEILTQMTKNPFKNRD